ncbi:MAG: 3-oxoacyl-ACP synthase III family protein [Thermoleophilaceae bacterium]
MGAKIVSTGGYVPGEAITNAMLEEMVGALPDGLLEGMHMERRHWIVDRETGEHTDSTSGMAAKAALQALERAAVEPADIDLLIVATATGDYMLPPTPALVQDELGGRCALLEIRSGGAGVVQGLDIARLYLERGIYRTAVVVGADAISPTQAQIFGSGSKRIKVRDRLLVYMFGDGAGAIVLQASDESSVIGSAIAGIGAGRPPGMEVRGGGGTHRPYLEQLDGGRPVDLHIDIEQANSYTATLTIEALADLLATTGVSADSIDLLVTPEADTEWMAEAFAEAGDQASAWRTLEGKVYNALPEIGAPGCAALPLGLDRAWVEGRLAPGRRVMLLGMETTKWIYAGMIFDWAAPSPKG